MCDNSFAESMLMNLTAAERAEIIGVAERGAKRCRDAMLNLRLTDPEHKIEMHRELEATADMWESLARSVLTPELPAIEGPPLSATQDRGVEERSEIERTLGEKG
jgi:hypothetical protein